MVIVSRVIRKDGLCVSKVYPCKISLRVKANSIVCIKHGKWLHSRCAGVNILTPKLQGHLPRIKCEEKLVRAVEQE